MAAVVAEARRHLLAFALGDRVPEVITKLALRGAALRATPVYVPWVRDFRSVVGDAQAVAYFLRTDPPGDLLRRLLLRHTMLPDADVVFPAARELAKEAPGEAKEAVLGALLATDNTLAVLMLPEVAGYMSVAEGAQAFDRVVGDALRPLDPYAQSPLGDARRAAADLLARLPVLLDALLSRVAAADETTRAIAGDIAVAALAFGRNLRSDHVPSFAKLLVASADALHAELAIGDSRYSVADPLAQRARGEPRRSRYVGMAGAALKSYPARLAGGLAFAILIAAVGVVLPSPVGEMRVGPAEIFAAAAVLVAVHVLAVELAANKLPSGFVHRVSWPVRLVLAYLTAAAGTSATLAAGATSGDNRALLLRLAAIAFLLLLAMLPGVVWELVGKSDALQAARRVGRDRALDMWLAARKSTEAFRARERAVAAITKLPYVTTVSTEPASRRHLRVLASSDGFVNVSIDRLADIDTFLRLNTRDDGPPAEVALLTQHGNPCRRGDVLAAVVADEPDIAVRAEALVRRSVGVRAMRASLRAQETQQALGQLLHVQAADRDIGNVHRTSHIIVSLLRSYLRGLSLEGERKRGFLENFVPMSPEQQAAEEWESAYRAAIVADDENRSEVLRTHGLRLADLSREFEWSSALELLVVRSGVLVTKLTPETAHSIAIVLAEFARISAELGRRAEYGATRRDAERLLWTLAALDPIPSSEQLSRQRFEELLAYGVVGDYFLEEDVFRGCDALVRLGRDVQPGRMAHIHLGVCRVGGLALTSRRYSLAARLYSLLTSAGADWSLIGKVARSETISTRLTALNTFAGNVFGSDPVASVGQYVDWAQELDAVFAAGSSAA